MQSTHFATRCVVFMGLSLSPRGLMPPEMPLGSCASLQLPLQVGTDLPRVPCHPSQPEQTPKVAKDISNGMRQPCVNNWVSPHPSSYGSHAALSQKVSCTSWYMRYLESSLLQTPTEKWVSPSEKKNPTLLRYRWISCILSLVLNHVSFSSWPTQIPLDPDCQTEINKERFLSLFPSFLYLFLTWTFNSSVIYQDCSHVL